jgi:hypothetical protein
MLKRLIERIKEKICDMQPSVAGLFQEKNTTTINIKTNDDCDNIWSQHLQGIKEEFNLNPYGFLRCKTISFTLHPNEQKIAASCFKDIVASDYARNEVLATLSEPPFGDPFIFKEYRYLSPMTIQHAWYLYLFEKHTGMNLPDCEVDEIVEFGGGYGNLCRIIHHLGYRGHYRIIDFNIMQEIQKIYLQKTLPKLIRDNMELDLLNEIKLLKKQGQSKKSVFFAFFSLCETSLKIRQDFECTLDNFDCIFIVYNNSFDGVDNVNYFKSLENKLSITGSVINEYHKSRKSWLFLYQRSKNSENLDEFATI